MFAQNTAVGINRSINIKFYVCSHLDDIRQQQQLY